MDQSKIQPSPAHKPNIHFPEPSHSQLRIPEAKILEARFCRVTLATAMIEGH